MKAYLTIFFLGVLTLIHSTAAPGDAPQPRFALGAGLEVASGSYGGDEDIDDLYIPVTGTIDYGRYAFRVTVPYLSVRGPEGTVVTGPGGEPVPGTGERTTNSGLGDVIGSVTAYDVVSNRRLGVTLDLSAAVKFGTADEQKGLGTGETDFTVEADVLKFFDQVTLLGSLGYKVRGDPTGIDLENSLLASLGGTYRFSRQTKAGLIFDYRESSITDRESIRELTAFASRRLGDDWRIQAYVLAGLSDSAPDWGAGLYVKRSL